MEHGTYPEIAQKVIEGANITCLNMHVILRWLKIRRESEFEVLNASNFEPSQDFQVEKVSHLRKKTRDQEKLNDSSFEPSQDHMHIPTCDIGSFDDFLSYLRVRPVEIF